MDVRIHNVVEVNEELCTYTGSTEFSTRTIRIKDDKGNEYSLTLFGKSLGDTVSQKIETEEYSA